MGLKDLFYVVDDLVNRVFGSLSEEGGRIGRMKKSSDLLILFGLVFFMSFLLAGGPFILVYKPSMLFQSSNSFSATFVARDPLDEGTIEGFIVGIMYLLGVGGIYWLYTASRGGRPSTITSMIAIAIVAVATFLLYLIGSWK
jgi:hypothetical protein